MIIRGPFVFGPAPSSSRPTREATEVTLVPPIPLEPRRRRTRIETFDLLELSPEDEVTQPYDDGDDGGEAIVLEPVEGE